MENTTHNNNVKKLEFKSSFKAAWEIIKLNWKALLAVIAFAFLIQLPFVFLDIFWDYRMGDVYESMFKNFTTQEMFFYWFFSALSMVVSMVVSYNLFKIYISISKGISFNYKDVFNMPTKNTFNYLIAQILFGILVFVGLLLLVVPGLYFYFKYAFASTLVVDKDMGVLDAFNKSSEITDGHKWTLFGIAVTTFFAGIGILLLGLICLIIGIIPALFIVTWLAIFIQLDLYKKLAH